MFLDNEVKDERQLKNKIYKVKLFHKTYLSILVIKLYRLTWNIMK